MSSLESRVLENGVWTTRTVDLQTILARNQDHTNESSSMTDADSPPPKLGVMTRTLVTSPIIRYIMPARIRDKAKNDVVFVGTSSVQIKELHPDGHLEDIATKADFGAKIIHARVCGEPRKPTDEDLDHHVKMEDQAADIEMPDDMAAAFSDHRQTDQEQASRLPPQILILTLTSGDLMFMYATETLADGIQFTTYRKPLPRHPSPLEQIGKHIAVDPRSRALAVSATQNSFTLFALHPMSKIRQDVEGNILGRADAFNPLREERHLNVKGVILRMEFLHPASGDDSHVILLLVVVRGGETRLSLWEWDSSSLRTAERKFGLGVRLPDSDKTPLLLIPLTICSAFILACETCMSLWQDVLGGADVRRTFLSRYDGFPTPPSSAQSQRNVLCTSWARPLRTQKHSSRYDNIYFCRDDGFVFFMAFDAEYPGLQEDTHHVGTLSGYVDSAFASLDLGIDQSDMLIAGGDMSAGALSVIHPGRESQTQVIETVANWTPLIDIVAANVPRIPSHRSLQPFHDDVARFPPSQGRLFACTGARGHGAITEIRRGCEARIGMIIPYHAGVNHIWSLPDHSQNDLKTVEQHLDDVSSGLEFDSKTLTAGAFGDIAVQVTQRSLRVARLGPTDSSNGCAVLPKICLPTEKIVAAAIHAPTCSIVTVVRKGDATHLCLDRVHNVDGKCTRSSIGESTVLASEPSCVYICSIGHNLYVLVGTATRTLQVYRVDCNLVPVVEHCFLNGQTGDDFPACESLAVVQRSDQTESPSLEYGLLCGLRDGRVFAYDIETTDTQFLDPSSAHLFHIGQTPVYLSVDACNPSRAFIACDQQLCRFDLHQKGIGASSIHSIWLSDHNEPGFQQGRISALTRVQGQPHLANTGLQSVLVSVSAEQLILIDLDDGVTTVPRHLPIGGTPRKLMYCPRLNILIVGYTRVVPKSPGRESGDDVRHAAVSSLRFVDPDRGLFSSESSQVEFYGTHSHGKVMLGKPGEVVLDLLDWTCTNGQLSDHFIVVATGSPIESTVKRSARHYGRVIFLSVKKRIDGEIDVEQPYGIMHEAPVYSLAAYGSRNRFSNLVTCSGFDIVIRRLNLNEKKFERMASCKIHSPCLYITVKEPYVRVTTSSDSVIVWKYDEIQAKFDVWSGDEISRSGQTHLLIPGSDILLATDKERGLVGMWSPPHRRIRSSSDTIFEAETPTIITRLRQITVRPSWRPRRLLPGVLPYGDEPDTDLIGSSMDGSLREITILREPAWRFLRYIQNLCCRSKTICPLSDAGVVDRPLEPKTGAPRFKNVDGDILVRLLEQGEPALKELLAADTRETKHLRWMGPNFSTPVQRRNRLATLYEELCGESFEDNVIALTLRYLHDVLQPAF